MATTEHHQLTKGVKDVRAKIFYSIDFEMWFSNSLIIYAALTQPKQLILVRWMSLETQGAPNDGIFPNVSEVSEMCLSVLGKPV